MDWIQQSRVSTLSCRSCAAKGKPSLSLEAAFCISTQICYAGTCKALYVEFKSGAISPIVPHGPGRGKESAHLILLNKSCVFSAENRLPGFRKTCDPVVNTGEISPFISVAGFLGFASRIAAADLCSSAECCVRSRDDPAAAHFLRPQPAIVQKRAVWICTPASRGCC